MLDFGAASTTGALLYYSASVDEGVASGGRFLSGEGYVINLADIYGTNLADTFEFTNDGGIGEGYYIDARGGADSVIGSGLK